MNPYAIDLSDDESRKSPAEQSSAGDTKGRRRSTRACTFTDPTHKRGPPKGYILALERRLHQVEALLGTIISSDDPRARSLVQDLSRDKLANHVINKVHVGPFGPAGREKHPFGSTKEDFLASISGDLGDNASEQSGSSQDAQNDPAFFTPSSDWQDSMKSLLTAARAEAAMAASVASPPPDTKPRRATYPSINSGHIPIPYMQAYYEPQPPPALSGTSVFYDQHHSLVQASAMRSSAQSYGTGPLPTVGNVYTDQDGRFRLDTTPPIPQQPLDGQPTPPSNAADDYYSSFHR
ncbi:uncharacterized protein TRAVEDRAFT_44201 [Trametes versicolor FP-101664 SS1]|uniref:uncharacterized protein n=1 Tax=Trametes versicolor (strain FP-101664) TaxID=717944 RepID=UPI00046230F3|nr:uncharacterized protein TRAVEDRAFT_44201 [Trametes versicolor FP-101664 SS1]EIW61386.1 hypothetical protein TRAVEDRAFT_44201 [Trametes versicolor FP-101664 SS1]